MKSLRLEIQMALVSGLRWNEELLLLYASRARGKIERLDPGAKRL